MKKAIITGPTGVVGTALIDELINNGYYVTAVCRPSSPRIKAISQCSNVQIVECPIDQLKTLSSVLMHDYDVFFHLAWEGTYGEARMDMYLQTMNILHTLDAVRLAKQLGCQVFVGAGSQSEYGHVDGVLYPDLPCNPDTGYGIAKLDAGRMSRIECIKLGMRYQWCRISSLFGPRDGSYTMIMSSIQKMLSGERVKFTKGEQVWDYLYCKDAARAFRFVAERGKPGAVYCLGSGKPRQLKDYIFAMRDAIDPSLDIGIGEIAYYPNQVMHLEVDISSLTNDTGFQPEYSFEQGIRETILWARNAVL